MSHPCREKRERAFVRHPSEMPIHIRSEGLLGQAPRHLRDVGLGGLCCRSAEPLEVGSEVSVDIPIGRHPFHARGAVVWCRPAHACYELGIQFLAREDLFAARMVEQLCYIERYRREVLNTEGRELSSADAAREWIARFAEDFPPLR